MVVLLFGMVVQVRSSDGHIADVPSVMALTPGDGGM
jgi:hypothetical protein